MAASLFLCAFFQAAISFGEVNPYAASYKTYETTYDAILKMYLRVLPAQCREQSRRRHDLYNEFMYEDYGMAFADELDTPEYAAADEAGKAQRRKEVQEKTLRYMKNKIGYAILDINGDGTEEMIIGCDKSYVYEIFTMDGGEVRELIKAGYRHMCQLLKDGSLHRFRHDGGGRSADVLYRLNGTGPVEFVKGYYRDGDIGYKKNLGEDCWFRIVNPSRVEQVTMEQHVPRSEAENWVKECEANYANIHFIPFSAYEKGFSGDGVAVLAVKGKTSGSQTVRIRSKPDKKSKVVVQKKVGTYLKAMKKEGEYYQVEAGKKTGYVHEDFLILLTELPEE